MIERKNLVLRDGFAFPALQSVVNEEKGIVFVLHGLYVQKETQINELNSLNHNGINAIAIDAPHHGERKDGLLYLMHNLSDYEKYQILLGIVQQQVLEIERIIDYYHSVIHKKVAFIGISMGAYSAFGSLRVKHKPDACVPILGSPDWLQRNKGQNDIRSILELSGPAQNTNKLEQTPLFIVNAGSDKTVFPEASRKFAKLLKPKYKDLPNKLVYLEYPESDHSMREEDWNDAWHKIITWLKSEGF